MDKEHKEHTFIFCNTSNAFWFIAGSSFAIVVGFIICGLSIKANEQDIRHHNVDIPLLEEKHDRFEKEMYDKLSELKQQIGELNGKIKILRNTDS